MSAYQYEHTGPIEPHYIGRLTYQVLFAPPELQAELLSYQRPRVRIAGDIEGVPVHLAWQPTGDGRLYLLIGSNLRSKLKRTMGEVITVRLNIADPNEVIVPEELAERLAQDDEAALLWERLAPGTQRAFAYYLDSAKSSAARAQRLEELLIRLEKGIYSFRVKV
jgi:hypothetical protein